MADMDQRAQFNWMRAWHDRDEHSVEATADAIAQWVTGREIRYGGPCTLQTYKPGVRRPTDLR